jgi:UDP-N-acetyl-D-glucosamine dehydrogenase
MKRVGVIGQGYVGLAVATEAATAGHDVTGFDTNLNLIKNLDLGKSHIEDVKDSKLKKLIKNSFYRPTNNPSDLTGCEVVIIAVPTPLDSERRPDLRNIEEAIQTIISSIKKSTLIINESTSYPGTLRNVIAKKISMATGINHRYAISPERIDPGNAKWNVKNTPRLVAGLDNKSAKEVVNFYSSFTKTLKLVSTPEVAEMAKLAENSFRYVNIAFVNELAKVAHGFDVDVNEVLEAANSKPYGFMKFFPGAGVGGHCIPIDPLYLTYESKQKGIQTPLLDKADEVNISMPKYVVKRILSDHNQDLLGKNVVVVGVSYKSDISDTRESPALEILQLLADNGANTMWHDPLVSTFNNRISSEIMNQDIAVVLSLHKSINLKKLQQINYVFDCTGKVPWAKSL